MLIQNLSDTNRFSETEKEIVHFILQNPRIVIAMSIRELAKETLLHQQPSLVYVKRLGLVDFLSLN